MSDIPEMSFPNSTLFPGLAVRSTNAAPGSSYSDSHFQYVGCWSSWATDQLWTCLARQLDVFQWRKLGVWEGAREFCRGGWARLLVCSFWVRRVFSWLNRATILGFYRCFGDPLLRMRRETAAVIFYLGFEVLIFFYKDVVKSNSFATFHTSDNHIQFFF